MLALIGMFGSLELKAVKQVVLFCPALVWLARLALIRIGATHPNF